VCPYPTVYTVLVVGRRHYHCVSVPNYVCCSSSMHTSLPILLIRINSHYVTFSSLPFKNECSVNDSVIIHHSYCNYRHDYFHHFSDCNVPSPTPTLLCSTISPTPMFLLRLHRCYVPPFLRLQCSLSDSNVAMFHHFSDANVPSPTPTLLCSTISPTPVFLLRLQRCYVPPFLRLQCSFSDSNVAMFHHFSDMTSFLKNSKTY
jgi:hypothetical protein